MERLERPSDCEHHRNGRCVDQWAKCDRCCWDCDLVVDCQEACEEAAASAWRELRGGGIKVPHGQTTQHPGGLSPAIPLWPPWAWRSGRCGAVGPPGAVSGQGLGEEGPKMIFPARIE